MLVPILRPRDAMARPPSFMVWCLSGMRRLPDRAAHPGAPFKPLRRSIVLQLFEQEPFPESPPAAKSPRRKRSLTAIDRRTAGAKARVWVKVAVLQALYRHVASRSARPRLLRGDFNACQTGLLSGDQLPKENQRPPKIGRPGIAACRPAGRCSGCADADRCRACAPPLPF